ncbi:hypothetical protein K458DRAFT_440868 [Lentithecium fluviatile CBS 122367]|uniref:Uncharacterized protein n=1 Tax=Lentithecium fluviatile CBS 122367 TaxID=1168545 RepID=A0A6G1JDH9_9PLEO|nr:hypothetical protein K458DRAFT_440868 [Lentithecium fluviatile CBS 122367]
MASPPTVLYPLTLPTLLKHVLTTQSSTVPTTLIICSSRETFLQHLLHALQLQDGLDDQGLQQLIVPTLHNLLTAQHVQVAFCASVQTLLAYLSAYAGATTSPSGVSEGRPKARIVLAGPLGLHAHTSSFSAQGLSRTFAAAVEVASRADAALVVVECLGAAKSSDSENDERDGKTSIDDGEELATGEAQEDPWEQEVPILNVSARKFGPGNADRAWAGRTVRAKRIAARWCRFRNLDEPD